MSKQAVDNYQFLKNKVYLTSARLFREWTEMFIKVHRAFLPDESSAEHTEMCFQTDRNVRYTNILGILSRKAFNVTQS